MNTTKTIIIAVIMIGLGILIGYFITRQPKTTMVMNHNMSMASMMDSMTLELEGQTGDAFDRAFINGMIVHHEGAVAMAELALKSAKHPEIKTMANAIISAQTSEIVQMKTWLKDWYGEE